MGTDDAGEAVGYVRAVLVLAAGKTLGTSAMLSAVVSSRACPRLPAEFPAPDLA